MIKLVTCIRRKPGLTFEQFRHHEECEHVPLVRSIMGSDLVAYVRNYPTQGGSTGFKSNIEYDAIVESHFPDRAAFDRAIAAANSPQNSARLKADYERYLDVGSVRQSLVEVRD